MDLTFNLTIPYDTTGPRFVPAPNYRGTTNIFFLCLSTLVICVWSAIHLDVPMYRQGAVDSFVRNVSWKLAALIVPELFLWTAVMQYLNARALRIEAQTYLPTNESLESAQVGTAENDPENTPLDPVAPELAGDDMSLDKNDSCPRRRLHQFTLTHGFYAAMGGYAFDFTSRNGTMDRPAFLPDGRTRITITASGVWFLMKYAPHLIPDLSEAHITDRSKAGVLGKALLILQVSWFCMNCIARLAQNLPLSLLEVTTVAHGLCTLLTYAVWWTKPLDIAEPTLICGPEARKVCALMKMCTEDSHDPLLGLLSFSTEAEMYYILGRCPYAERVFAESNTVSLEPCKQFLDGTDFMPGTCMPKNEGLDQSVIYRSRSKPWYVRRQNGYDSIELNREDVCRWRLASETLRSYGMTVGQVWVEAQEAQLPYLTDGSTLHINTEFGRYGLKSWQALILLPSLPAIYGCAHFLGWSSHFPTSIEQTLWRIAAATTTFWGAGFVCIFPLVSVVLALLEKCCSFFDAGESKLITVTQTPMALLYATATGYLLVESVRQLLYLDPAAYQLPVWSNYWPHFA